MLTTGLLLGGPPICNGQTPDPQDELDLQGRASLAIGSGARALGMGGAFLARADDATAASWNPAGLSYLKRPELCLVGAVSGFDASQRNAAGVVTTNDRSSGTAPDFLSAALPFEFGPVSGAAQVSFQRAFSFDGTRRIRRTISEVDRPVVFEVEGVGGFDVFALGTGVRVTRGLRLGLTLNGWLNDDWLNGYRLTRAREGFNPSLQKVRFDISGWNANLGALWSPIEDLNLGVVAKTPFTARAELARKRQDEEFDRENSYSSDDVRLQLPGAVGVGVSWRARSTLTVSADYTRTFWSGARIYNYFTLPLAGQPRPPDSVFDRLSYPSLTMDEQEDTEQLRFGAEHVVIGARVKWPLRAGFFTDRQYFRAGDESIPRFIGFTLGAGILVGPILFDGAFVRESGDYADGAGGRTDVTLHRWFFSLIYRHQSQP